MPNNQKKGRRSGRRKPRGQSKPAFSQPFEGAFPPSTRRRMNYSDIFTLTESAAGVGVHQLIRAADIYDPDFTGLGHQPMYFDQLCTSAGPYLVFCVPAAKFRCRFVNTGSTPVLLTVFPSLTASAPSNRTQAAEKPYVWRRVLPPAGTGGAMIDKNLDINNARFTGVPRATYMSDFSGNFGSSAAGPVMVFSVWGLGASVATVVLSLTVIYDVHFRQLGPQGTS